MVQGSVGSIGVTLVGGSNVEDFFCCAQALKSVPEHPEKAFLRPSCLCREGTATHLDALWGIGQRHIGQLHFPMN